MIDLMAPLLLNYLRAIIGPITIIFWCFEFGQLHCPRLQSYIFALCFFLIGHSPIRAWTQHGHIFKSFWQIWPLFVLCFCEPPHEVVDQINWKREYNRVIVISWYRTQSLKIQVGTKGEKKRKKNNQTEKNEGFISYKKFPPIQPPFWQFLKIKEKMKTGSRLIYRSIA